MRLRAVKTHVQSTWTINVTSCKIISADRQGSHYILRNDKKIIRKRRVRAMVKKNEKKKRGRPPSATAASHDAILNAVYNLLHEKSVRDLTIEEVARRAGVGKPTIYKWWPSKAALVMAMLDERIAEDLTAPGARDAEEAIRGLVKNLVRRFNGFAGKVAV